MQKTLKVLNHRDFVLSLAVVVGLILGEHSRFLAEISMYTLMAAMVASTISFTFKTWKNPLNVIKPIGYSFLLSYVLYGSVALVAAWLFFYESGMDALWAGFVLLVAAPPGPAVIPFSAMLKGDKNFATTGLFGLYLLAMVLTPGILFIFLGTSLISPAMIFTIMAQIIIIPVILSRFLRHPKVLPYAQKSSGTAIKWLFFLVITPIVGMNRHVFFQEPLILLQTTAVLLISMFILGWAYNIVMVKAKQPRPIIISSTFMLVIKSAAFSAVVAFNFFGDEPVVAMPAAVLSVFIVLFAVSYSLFVKHILKPPSV